MLRLLALAQVLLSLNHTISLFLISLHLLSNILKLSSMYLDTQIAKVLKLQTLDYLRKELKEWLIASSLQELMLTKSHMKDMVRLTQ